MKSLRDSAMQFGYISNQHKDLRISPKKKPPAFARGFFNVGSYKLQIGKGEFELRAYGAMITS